MIRAFALVIGIVLLVLGILGFIPLFKFGAEDYLLGIFAVDAVHNVFHLLVGALGVGAYYCLPAGGNSRFHPGFHLPR